MSGGLQQLAHRLTDQISSGQLSGDDAFGVLKKAIRRVSGGDRAHAEALIQHLCQPEDLSGEFGLAWASHYARLVYRIADDFGDPFWRALAAHTMGNLLKKQGSYQEAEGWLRVSLDNFDPDHPAHAAVAAGDLGATLYHRGRYAESVGLLRRALEDSLSRGDTHNQLEWKLSLGNALVFTSRNQEALDLLEDGLRQARSLQKHKHESAFLTGIANVYENLGRYEESVSHHQRALEISRKIGDKLSESFDHLNFGNLHYRFNRFELALASYHKGHALAVEAGHQAQKVQLAGQIASMSLRVGRLSEAISVLEKSVQECRDAGLGYQLLRNLGNLGSTYHLAGRLPEAWACHEESMNLSARSGDLRSFTEDLGNLARVALDLGEPAQALELAEKAREIADRLQDPQLVGRCEWALARLLGALPDRQDEVWKHYESAMSAIESFREHVRDDQERIDLYGGNQRSLYVNAVSWLLESGQTEKAFEVAERSKSRLMLDVMAERRTGRLSRPESAQGLLKRTRGVGSRAAVLSFFVLEEETVLFWMAPGAARIEVVRAPCGESALLSWLEDWLGVLARIGGDEPPADSLPETLEMLSKLEVLLVKPVRDWLKESPGIQDLLLVPHRYLHNMPLHAALDRETGRYLAQDVTVIYLPALQLLAAGSISSFTADSSVLVVGEPATDMPPLPGAFLEALAVADLLKSEVLIGKEATVQAFAERAPRARAIHLACHGIYNDRNPERSHLVLAGNEPLTAAGISELPLGSVDLAVTAACESARARPAAVDESLGLTRAWLLSGVRFVLGAQWEIVDETSMSFMIEFYGCIKAGMSYVRAFGRAQSLLLGRSAPENDPRLWAPFTLIGYSR